MSVSYPDLNLTNFPESVDAFVQMLDIVASDATALSAYQSAMEVGNITQANAALSSMTNGAQKILSADKINKIFDSIEALERFLGTDIVPYVAQLQTNWQTEVGKFYYAGEYTNSQAYNKNNIVSYASGVYTYLFLCIQNTTAGILPNNTAYWKQFTIVGIRGLSGVGMSYLYSWDNTTPYNPQDCVTNDGKVWGCLVANTGSEPTALNANWEELGSLAGEKYPIQATEPIGLENGNLWFQTIGSDF